MGSILHFNVLPLERNSATLTSFACSGLLLKQQPVLTIFTYSLMAKWRENGEEMERKHHTVSRIACLHISKESGAEQLENQEDVSALFLFLSPFYPSTRNTHNLTDKQI